MIKPFRVPSLLCLAFGVAVSIAQPTVAQGYPSGNISFIVTYPPGSVVDITARVISPEVAQILGETVIVENKPGADTAIAYDYVARQKPADGHTFVLSFVQGWASLPLLGKDLPFDPLKDLVPVIDVAESRLVLGSAKKFPWNTMQGMVQAAHANPGKYNYGVGSSLTKIMMEGFTKDFKIDAVQVPFAGGGPWHTALGQGVVEMGLIAENGAVTLSERLNALAITGAQRSPNFPDTPTFIELGHPNFRSLTISLGARDGTPKDIIDKVHAAVAQVLGKPEVQKRLAAAGLEVTKGSTPESAARTLTEQAEFFADIAASTASAK